MNRCFQKFGVPILFPRYYRKDLGEEDISLDPPKTLSELKGDHLAFLEESTQKHPNKRFVVMVDAVNQFHDSLQAWKMWWLPSKGRIGDSNLLLRDFSNV